MWYGTPPPRTIWGCFPAARIWTQTITYTFDDFTENVIPAQYGKMVGLRLRTQHQLKMGPFSPADVLTLTVQQETKRPTKDRIIATITTELEW